VTLTNPAKKRLRERAKKDREIHRNDTFMMAYGNGVTDINLNKFVKFRQDYDKIATVVGILVSSLLGELRLKGDRVVSFCQKPSRVEQTLRAVAFFVFNKDVFGYIWDDDACDFENGPLKQIANRGNSSVQQDGMWTCVGTLKDTGRLNSLWNEGNAFWKILNTSR
jgi:glucose-1-phosphate cytidylyltransferase